MIFFWLAAVTTIVGWSWWALAEKKALECGTPWQTLFVSLLLKTLIAWPLAALFLYRTGGVTAFSVSPNVWMFVFAAVLVNGIAIILLRFLLQKQGVGLTIALTETAPIVTTILAFLFLGEMLSLMQVFGIVLTTVGVVLISKG